MEFCNNRFQNKATIFNLTDHRSCQTFNHTDIQTCRTLSWVGDHGHTVGRLCELLPPKSTEFPRVLQEGLPP